MPAESILINVSTGRIVKIAGRILNVCREDSKCLQGGFQMPAGRILNASRED